MTFAALRFRLAWGDSDSDPSLFHHFIRLVFPSVKIKKCALLYYTHKYNTTAKFRDLAAIESKLHPVFEFIYEILHSMWL